MGPGIITGFAGNDAGGVTTYTAVGARYGFEMMWLLLLSTAGLLVIQEMCARMGAVTGKGLSDLIRERFGVRWTIVAMLALLIANGTNVAAEYAGIAASLGLLGVPSTISVPLAGIAIWVLVVFFTYRIVERALFVVILAFVAYPITAIIVHPDWGAVGRGLVIPTLPVEQAALIAALARAQTGLLFSVGLLGASLLAATVMPLSTSYAICEAFGWESGISKNFNEAPVFMGLFTLLLVAGGIVVVLFPQHLLIQLILASQAINGLLLPVVLVFILRLASDRSLMGGSATGRVTTPRGWGVAALASLLSVGYVAV